MFTPPVTSPDYDHLHLKLISLKNHGQCKLCRILGCSKNKYPVISSIFTIMRLYAHMHNQCGHLFVKINKRDGACVSLLHETISLFKEISFTCFKTCTAVTSGIRLFLCERSHQILCTSQLGHLCYCTVDMEAHKEIIRFKFFAHPNTKCMLQKQRIT